MNNQATALTKPAAIEVATKAKRKAAFDVGIPPLKTNAPTDGKGPTDEAIRLDAYLNWEAAGKPAGDGLDFWLQAESNLRRLLAKPQRTGQS